MEKSLSDLAKLLGIKMEVGMNQVRGHEFTAISTPDELVLCIELPDGEIIKGYERRRISDDEVEVVQYRNRDRRGNFYTTRHIYRISEGAVINPDFERKK